MIKKLKSELLTSIKNKRLNVFLLFLLSSFIILIFTKLSKEYTNTITFNIEKINVPQDKVILNDTSHKLSVTLKTHGFNWFKYYLSKPSVSIDFSKDVYENHHTYVFTKSISYLNEIKPFQNEVKLLNVNPDTLVFRFDTNMVKKVPIIVEADISFAPGYDIMEQFTTEPDSVVVVGPHEIVEIINALKTEELQLSNVKTDISTALKLVLPDNVADLKFSTKEVQLLADVEKFTEGTIKLPIQIINIPQDVSIKYFPKEIKVSYYTSLDNFSNIKANEFKVRCDFNDVKENQTILIPKLVKVPEKVKHVKLNLQQIEFIIL